MLKLFGQFKNIILEMYGEDDNTGIVRKYAVLTGEKCSEQEFAFIDRKGKNWKNQFRVFFNASQDVIDSLRLIGINVLENKTPESIIKKYGGAKQDYPYTFSNGYWFWKLVEYGYKLGINTPISYEMVEVREHLRDLKIPNLYHINNHESESPIIEAKLLMA